MAFSISERKLLPVYYASSVGIAVQIGIKMRISHRALIAQWNLPPLTPASGTWTMATCVKDSTISQLFIRTCMYVYDMCVRTLLPPVAVFNIKCVYGKRQHVTTTLFARCWTISLVCIVGWVRVIVLLPFSPSSRRKVTRPIIRMSTFFRLQLHLFQL